MKHLILLASLVLLSVIRVQAAENVYLTLKSNGTEIKGESSVKSLGRQDSIECFSYEQESTMAAGKRQYQPLLIRKRIDKASPLLMKAMLENSNLDATFKFFRPNPTGDGTTEQFYTVTLSGARITSIHQRMADTRDKTAMAQAPEEEIEFSFTKISWTYTNGGMMYEDSPTQMTGSSGTSPVRPFLRIPRSNK